LQVLKAVNYPPILQPAHNIKIIKKCGNIMRCPHLLLINLQ
jgi:hypothetical protein